MSGESRGEASVSHRMRVSMCEGEREKRAKRKEGTTLRPDCPLKVNSEANRGQNRATNVNVDNKQTHRERDTGVVDLSRQPADCFLLFGPASTAINHARLALRASLPAALRRPPPLLYTCGRQSFPSLRYCTHAGSTCDDIRPTHVPAAAVAGVQESNKKEGLVFAARRPPAARSRWNVPSSKRPVLIPAASPLRHDSPRGKSHLFFLPRLPRLRLRSSTP